VCLAGLLVALAPPTSCIVAALFIGAIFLSQVKMNWKPGEATICSSSGSSSSGVVVRNQSRRSPAKHTLIGSKDCGEYREIRKFVWSKISLYSLPLCLTYKRVPPVNPFISLPNPSSSSLSVSWP
jgi:hypothetical protein